MTITLLLVEDNPNLRPALGAGLETTGAVTVQHAVVGGTLTVESQPGAFTRVSLLI